jgi:hypothetical protein
MMDILLQSHHRPTVHIRSDTEKLTLNIILFIRSIIHHYCGVPAMQSFANEMPKAERVHKS